MDPSNVSVAPLNASRKVMTPTGAAAAAVVAVITATLLFIFRGKIKLLANNVFGRKGVSDDEIDDENDDEDDRSNNTKLEDGKQKRGKTSFGVDVDVEEIERGNNLTKRRSKTKTKRNGKSKSMTTRFKSQSNEGRRVEEVNGKYQEGEAILIQPFKLLTLKRACSLQCNFDYCFHSLVYNKHISIFCLLILLHLLMRLTYIQLRSFNLHASPYIVYELHS